MLQTVIGKSNIKIRIFQVENTFEICLWYYLFYSDIYLTRVQRTLCTSTEIGHISIICSLWQKKSTKWQHLLAWNLHLKLAYKNLLEHFTFVHFNTHSYNSVTVPILAAERMNYWKSQITWPLSLKSQKP